MGSKLSDTEVKAAYDLGYRPCGSMPGSGRTSACSNQRKALSNPAPYRCAPLPAANRGRESPPKISNYVQCQAALILGTLSRLVVRV